MEILIAQQTGELLSPLYEEDAIRSDQVVEGEGFEFALGIDSVKVDVIEGGLRSAIFVYECESGAGDVVGRSGSEAFRNSLYESCFAGAEVAAQENDERGRKFGGKVAAEGDGLVCGVSDGFGCGLGCQDCGLARGDGRMLPSLRKVQYIDCDGLEAGRGLEFLRNRVEETAVQRAIERHAQFAVIIVVESDKTEGLHAGALVLAGWLQHFGHAADSAGAGVECDFDEIAGGEFMRQLQQTPGDGNELEFRPRLVASLGHYRGCD